MRNKPVDKTHIIIYNKRQIRVNRYKDGLSKGFI